MPRFRSMKTLQKSSSVHVRVHNRHLVTRLDHSVIVSRDLGIPCAVSRRGRDPDHPRMAR